ncbi:MAG: DNA methyltransferase [Acidobacteriota bacterium]|nr:DNA methyltransferase [Acidobacteriota bacterium]
MKPEEVIKILEEKYKNALELAVSEKSNQVSNDIKSGVDIFIEKIDTDKSLVQVIVTSLVKKIISPEQDIRLHMAKFDGGYSARVLDTRVTSPFFKKYFPTYANKETAFLTKATRAEIIWNLADGRKLPFRSKTLIEPFLNLMDKIQNTSFDLNECLTYIFLRLQLLSQKNQTVFDNTLESADFSDVLDINGVLTMLIKHFNSKLSSRLPVIAIYSAYIQLFKTIKRYEGKILRPLNVHTSADKHGYGDIEIWNDDETPFEMVEIKHNIAINRNLIFDVVKKTENTTVKRYYVLTTFKGSFVDDAEENYINKLTLKIKKERDLEVIPNGIIHSLKYYLRFIEDYQEFIKTYTEELIRDAKKSTEVKNYHIEIWQAILKEYQLES